MAIHFCQNFEGHGTIMPFVPRQLAGLGDPQTNCQKAKAVKAAESGMECTDTFGAGSRLLWEWFEPGMPEEPTAKPN